MRIFIFWKYTRAEKVFKGGWEGGFKPEFRSITRENSWENGIFKPKKVHFSEFGFQILKFYFESKGLLMIRVLNLALRWDFAFRVFFHCLLNFYYFYEISAILVPLEVSEGFLENDWTEFDGFWICCRKQYPRHVYRATFLGFSL